MYLRVYHDNHTMIISIAQVRKWRYRDVKRIAQLLSAGKNSNPGTQAASESKDRVAVLVASLDLT